MTTVDARDNLAGRDLYVIGGDLDQRAVYWGLRQLKATPIRRAAIIPTARFAVPDGYQKAIDTVCRDQRGIRQSHICILVGPRSAGRTTAAERVLDACMDQGEELIRLTADWETPDAELIPRDKATGYLLDLTGHAGRLTDGFLDQLVDYETAARSAHGVLLVLVDPATWGGRIGSDLPVAWTTLAKPLPEDIVKRQLEPDPLKKLSWLQEEGSLFKGLLPSSTTPTVAVRLADALKQATSITDDSARQRFLTWHDKIWSWFNDATQLADGQQGRQPSVLTVEMRALLIAAAFHDGAPLQVIVDAAAVLLEQPQLNWQAVAGGPLAGPDSAAMCEELGMTIVGDGAFSLDAAHPGMSVAVLRHVWRKRSVLVPIIGQWLTVISGPKGTSVAHLALIAAKLVELTETEGPDSLLDLIEKWLTPAGRNQSIERGRRDLVVAILGDLASHPVHGPLIRQKLADWAALKTQPQHQLAVALVCAGQFGHDYEHMALTRLRYILESTGDERVRDIATRSLRTLALNAQAGPRVLEGLVAWAAGETPSANVAAGRSAFLTVVSPVPEDPKRETNAQKEADRWSALNTLTRHADEAGTAVRVLLGKGWLAAWQGDGDAAAPALRRWYEASEAGHLAEETVLHVFLVLVDGRVARDPLLMSIRGASRLHARIIRALVAGRDPGAVESWERAVDMPQQFDAGSDGDAD